jgi:hypothetical protein
MQLIFVALAALVLSVQANVLPVGFATFFGSASCPTGSVFRFGRGSRCSRDFSWVEIPSAMGRLVVSVSDSSVAGLTLHDALGDREVCSFVVTSLVLMESEGSIAHTQLHSLRYHQRAEHRSVCE